jgi:hypothetical protein
MPGEEREPIGGLEARPPRMELHAKSPAEDCEPRDLSRRMGAPAQQRGSPPSRLW